MADIDSKLSSSNSGVLGSLSGELKEDYSSILMHGKELDDIKHEVIRESLKEIDSGATQIMFKAALPSLILLLLSFFVGAANVPIIGNVFQSISHYINPSQPPVSTEFEPINLWWFPFVIYAIFVACAFRAHHNMRREISSGRASEVSIIRIIDKYSGIVDGIGTALPLLGAAILLISIELGPTIFLGFAVPFEIKSILILAIAKLFESVFDALALKYQEIQEKLKTIERLYYYQNEVKSFEKMIAQNRGDIKIESSVSEEHLRRVYDTMKATEQLGITIKNLISEISTMKLPDERSLKELQTTAQYLKETIGSLKDNNVLKSLDNLVYLTGKRVS